MVEKVEISLKPSLDSPEEFEIEERNVMRVRIQTPTGYLIDNPIYIVEVTGSPEAMLGFATELIRDATLEPNAAKVWHIRPAQKSFSSQVLGIYLHPESCQLLVAQVNHGTLGELID